MCENEEEGIMTYIYPMLILMLIVAEKTRIIVDEALYL